MFFLYIILSTTTILELKDAILFYKVSFLCVYTSIFFASTLCMCVMYSTDYFDDKTVSMPFDLMIVLSPTTPACTWWNRPEDPSSGKLESTHPTHIRRMPSCSLNSSYVSICWLNRQSVIGP